MSATERGLDFAMAPASPATSGSRSRGQASASLAVRTRPRRAEPRGVVVAEPLRRVAVLQRHADADRQLRLGVVPTLRALDHPCAIRTLH